jgi:hypothetical protein
VRPTATNVIATAKPERKPWVGAAGEPSVPARETAALETIATPIAPPTWKSTHLVSVIDRKRSSTNLLLGLLREEQGIPAGVLESLDVTVERVRAQVVTVQAIGVQNGRGPWV